MWEFLGYKHPAIGRGEKRYRSFTSNIYQQWLSTAVAEGHAEAKCQEPIWIHSVSDFSWEFSATKRKFALLNSSKRLLKPRTRVLISAAWFREIQACRNHEGKALRNKNITNLTKWQQNPAKRLFNTVKSITYFSCILRNCLLILTG